MSKIQNKVIKKDTALTSGIWRILGRIFSNSIFWGMYENVYLTLSLYHF